MILDDNVIIIIGENMTILLSKIKLFIHQIQILPADTRQINR